MKTLNIITACYASTRYLGKPINAKKGQFLTPWEMRKVAEKLPAQEIPRSCCANVEHPLDITHSVHQPCGRGNSSDRERKFVAALAHAACAVAGLFIETIRTPTMAPVIDPT